MTGAQPEAPRRKDANYTGTGMGDNRGTGLAKIPRTPVNQPVNARRVRPWDTV